MKIRKATNSDIPSLLGMWKEMRKIYAGKEEYELKPNAAELWKKDLEGWINSNDNLVLVAEEDGELFGYAIFSIELLPKIYKREKECGLNTVFVSPKSRRKGIGSKLIKEGEEWAKKRGFSQFSLSVSVENDPAVKTYLKNGFAKFRYKLIKNL